MINNTLLQPDSTAGIMIFILLKARNSPFFDVYELQVLREMIEHFYPLVVLKAAFKENFNISAFDFADSLLEI